MVKCHGDRVVPTVSPIVLCDIKAGLCASFIEVRWDVDFNPELLWELGGSIWVVRFRITSGDQDSAIGKEL